MSSKSAVGVLGALFWLTNTPGPISAQNPSLLLPPAVEQYMATEVHLTSAERARLLAGAPLIKLLPSDQSKEMFVFGAVWIDASPAEYVRRVKDIENWEKGGSFHITRRIGDPPAFEDFAELTLPADDVKDLRRCKPGDCDVKLSAHDLQVFRDHVRWGTPAERSDADAAFRRLAFEYVTGYREGGNARLAVYRDQDDPVFVASELRSLIERAPSLARTPDLQTYLLDYPAARLSGASDFLYWQEAQFGLKPTIRINHLVIQERPGQTVIASKMLYASHYFWTALEQRVLQPDPARGPGFWFMTISRSRSDGLKGFIGWLVRGRVRSEVQRGTENILTSTKTRLERR